MVEQWKAVTDNCTVYGNRVKGSTRVLLVWKWPSEGFDFFPEHDRIPRDMSLREWMGRMFLGDVLPVTGLPGHR